MKNQVYVLLMILLLVSCKNDTKKDDMASETKTTAIETIVDEDNQPSIEITPVSHATFVMNWDDTIIYVDPVGEEDTFTDMPEADIILVTDIHGDHFNEGMLNQVAVSHDALMVPKAVQEKMTTDLDNIIIINNGETKQLGKFSIEAIPMYNLTEERLKFHTKGRGNGYVIEKDGYRVYISGDTEDIQEMRNLKNIDKAFICMNLPYTMTVENAASAVLQFKPKEVIPYHYRGTDGYLDVDRFKEIMDKAPVDINTTLLAWYPDRKS